MKTPNKVYNIYFEKESGYVVMDWDGYATSRQFREGTELMLALLNAYNATKVLADIQDMLLIGMNDQKWMEHEFLPRAIKKGFKACAIIRPKSYFNNVAVESISYKIDQKKLLINFFNNVEEAKHWLLKLKI
jgi:hypothetical protein